MSILQNQRLAVGQAIATPLRALEASIDDALENAGHLIIAMSKGRKTARVAAAVGTDAFDELGNAVAALFHGRSSIVACHGSLETTRHELGLPVRAYGDESQKPPAPSGVEAAPLRVVA